MNPTKNDIAQNTRAQLVKLLNERLADTIDLFNQLKQAHWNVKGPSFIALHELFDDIAERIESWSDDIAERAVQLGGMVDGTSQTVAHRSTLAAYDTSITDGLAHVDAVSSALAKYGAQIRKAIDTADGAGDADTADLFTQISRAVDKDLWFVEAHLQDAGEARASKGSNSKHAAQAVRAKNRHAPS